MWNQATALYMAPKRTSEASYLRKHDTPDATRVHRKLPSVSSYKDHEEYIRWAKKQSTENRTLKHFCDFLLKTPGDSYWLLGSLLKQLCGTWTTQMQRKPSTGQPSRTTARRPERSITIAAGNVTNETVNSTTVQKFSETATPSLNGTTMTIAVTQAVSDISSIQAPTLLTVQSVNVNFSPSTPAPATTTASPKGRPPGFELCDVPFCQQLHRRNEPNGYFTVSECTRAFCIFQHGMNTKRSCPYGAYYEDRRGVNTLPDLDVSQSFPFAISQGNSFQYRISSMDSDKARAL
ncbi:hypothetical protein BV898_07404 [Hypsibius exemplaris]|uniref:Uncharacterized protein n=1 Tax=Hypsibius exemplaris TaxID=2072580 RepID=A0A1W0WTP1_HYPEX|nr:hypothetical protein BV898_07404 [Hypsibius exemplaris]